MNRSDYERLAPPNSYIHVADFTSPTDLAKYLLHLQNNPGKKYHVYLFIYFDEYYEYLEARVTRIIVIIYLSIYLFR